MNRPTLLQSLILATMLVTQVSNFVSADHSPAQRPGRVEMKVNGGSLSQGEQKQLNRNLNHDSQQMRQE